jgi:putative hydrolase of the HAD superfamily
MRKCLIFDADDTLWENNIYFEAAIEEFLNLVRPFACGPQRVLALLREVEQELIPLRGYGSRNFIHALGETFRRLYDGKDGVDYHRGIERIGERLLNHPMQIMPEAQSTLQLLSARHRLMLFTKGDFQEQSSKLSRSGLQEHFAQVEIAIEKNTAAYHDLVLRHSLDRESTFMVGNSPRSDVLPALEAGLWAVFVPHPHTWELEHEEVKPHPRLLQAQSLRELPSLLQELSQLQD